MTPNPMLARTRTRRLTLELPTALVQNVIRLAELRGRSFDQELAEDFAFLLALSGGPRPATMLEHLFEVERLNLPTERVSVSLPRPLYDRLGALARAFGTTRSRAVAAVMHRGLRGLIAAQAMGVEQGMSFEEAFLALLARERIA